MMQFILGFLLLLSCMSMGSRPPAPKVVPSQPSQDQIAHQTPQSTVPFLSILKCTNCYEKELAFLKNAEVVTNRTVASKCFQEKLSAMELIQTNGKSPSQVALSLQGADVKIDIEMYYTLKRVLGYTLPDAKMIWVNRKYMMSWNVCDLGSLLSHETSHKIGYDHDYQSTSRRPKSVPYSINRAFEACCTK